MFGLALCAGVGVTSCSSDLDDPMDTIPYNRVLTPMNFEAEVVATKGTDVTFSWSAVQNASAYVLELFDAVVTTEQGPDGKDVEVFNPPVYEATAPACSFEVPADQVPYTVEGLEVDKTFYARVRGVSGSVPASHWAYLLEPVSTSAVRQLLNPVIIERTASTVKVGWDDAEDKLDLTSIRVQAVVPAEGETARTIALTDEEKNACAVVVSDLDACRNYKFTLLFGKSGGRGVVTAWTRPETGNATLIESADAFRNAITGATGDLELLLAYQEGVVYDLTPVMTNKEGVYDPYEFAYGLTIYGQSTEAGEKPVVKASFKNMAAGNSYRFEDITVDGAAQGFVFTTGAELGDAEFVNCEFYGFSKGLWSGADGCGAASLVYDGVYAHDIPGSGGDFIDIRGGNYGKIEIKNSTFYACARSFLRISDKPLTVGDIAVANCTFNQVTTTPTSSNNSGIFHVRHSSGTDITGSFVLSNCVFLNMNNDNETENGFWVRMTRDSNENYAPFCSGNIYYNVGHMYAGKNGDQNTFFPTKSVNLNGDAFTTALAMADGGMMLEEDPCTNSIAGKMYLKNGIIAANKVGDPRWWDATQPVIVRPTELTTVVEPTVWDFTDKTKFSSETIETNQIIENIRIYAPAEIVMGEGLTFAGASATDKNGRPTSSALGFRVQGVGAVEVTTVDAGFNASLQLIAAGDRYTMQADGKTHKVVLGDLVGENDIYLLAGSAVTILNVTWTDDLTPESTVKQLAAPKVTFDVASLDKGTEQAVTASWVAVENAASYEVTFKGQKSETTETSYTIDAATVAALIVGEYELSVVAKPVATSSKYVASEAGVATLKIKKGFVPGQKTVSWNFNDASFDATAAAIGTTDNTTANVTYTVDGVGLNLVSGGSKLKIETRAYNGVEKWRCFRTGGKSSMTGAAISFTAMADGGMLAVTGKNPSGGATETTELKVEIYVNGAAAGEVGAIVGKDFNTVELELDGKVQAGDVVNLVTGGGISFAMMEYTYIDPNFTGEVTTAYAWDFKNDTATFSAQEVETSKEFTPEHGRAITFHGGAVADKRNITIEGGKRIKMGGATQYTDGAPTLRYLSFVAEGRGELSFVHASASSSGAGRMTKVMIDGKDAGESAEAPTSGFSADTANVSWTLDTTAGQTVCICVTGGINFESITWTETK